MENRMIFEDFAGKLGAWADKFRPFIESKEMFDMYARIKADASKEHIVPSSDNTFNAFAKSVPWNIKVVWYLMDPYPRRYKNKENQATGIAMDCSNSPDDKLQPSLELFYEGMEKDLGIEVDHNKSLEYLLRQGVLMLNTDLTCKLNKTGSHRGVWEPFQKFFLEEIMSQKAGIIYVLAGKESERMEQYINPIGNYILKVEHPMAAGHKNMAWDCKGVFKRIDSLLKEHKNGEIKWDRRDWERGLDDPPF